MDRILQKTPKEIADQQLSFVMAGLNDDLIHHPAVGEEELLTLKVKDVFEEYQRDKEKVAGSDGNDKKKRNFFPRI